MTHQTLVANAIKLQVTDDALEVYAHFYVDGARGKAVWKSFCNGSDSAEAAGLMTDQGERLTDDATHRALALMWYEKHGR